MLPIIYPYYAITKTGRGTALTKCFATIFDIKREKARETYFLITLPKQISLKT